MFRGVFRRISVSDIVSAPGGALGVIIDVRSESEFADAHIPGAVNVPLLNDQERAEVGTLYKKTGPERARERGLEIVKPKIQALYTGVCGAIRPKARPEATFAQPAPAQWEQAFDLVAQEIMISNFGGLLPLAGEEPEGELEMRPTDPTGAAPVIQVSVNQEPAVKAVPVTFYCWRGGARSKSMALFAASLGFYSQFLHGGHKAYRDEALKFLNAEKYPFKLCTLYGLTGSGKTKIVQKWKAEGKPVIDLEGLAHHRGSAFGQVGIEKFGSQKDFENNLYWEMRAWANRGAKFVIVEGESRRIGRVNLPEAFMKAMLEGYHVKVNQTVEERVQNILKDYVEPLDEGLMLQQARQALEGIRKRLGGERFVEFAALLEARDYAEFTRRLLVEYYDKMYALSRASDEFYDVTIRDAGDWDNLIAGLS